MNKEFIERIENKVNSIDILDKDPFVEESCKNIYRALLVVAENENPPISNISDILNDANKTIELLKKFDGINKEKYNCELSYIVIDVNNNQTLLYLIELLRQSIYYNDEADDKETTTNDKNDKDININRINKILSSVFIASQIVKIEKIDRIKFLPDKDGYTIEIKDNHDKFYYMFIDDLDCYVAQVRENSIDGKIVYIPDDDYIPPTTNEKNNNDVTKFAQEHGYKGAKYIGNWKEYKVYEPYVSGNDISFTGLPLVILVNDKGEIRMSTSDEAMATLDDKSFIESFEENRINEELNFSSRQEAVDAYMKKFGGFPFMAFRGLPDAIVIEEVKKALKLDKEISVDFDDNDSFMRKYKIDNNGHENEETRKIELEKCPNCNESLLIMGDNKGILTCPKCKSNYMSLDGNIYPTANMTTQNVTDLINDIDNKIAELEIEKNKIDKDIESNFEEVSKYSILNKTLEELLSAKKKFINDWDVLLFNTISEHWIMNSATYRTHIVSIIDAILRRIDDGVSKQQLELLNSITNNKYFSNQDRDSVIKIVKQLKELEDN